MYSRLKNNVMYLQNMTNLSVQLIAGVIQVTQPYT